MYTRPTIERELDTHDRVINYEHDKFSFWDLQSVANKFVEKHRLPKCIKEFTPSDMREIATLLTQPFHGTKILLEIQLSNKQGYRVFDNYSRNPNPNPEILLFEVLELIENENNPFPNLVGIVRTFRLCSDQQRPIPMYEFKEKETLSVEWTQNPYTWKHSFDNVNLHVRLCPAMGYSLDKPF